jgi:uncharacterized integral membrane protein
VAAVLMLTLLVIFIAQNTQRSTIHFLGARGSAPTAVVVLVAAISGAGIAIVFAVARIVQLRRVAKDPLHANS